MAIYLALEILVRNKTSQCCVDKSVLNLKKLKLNCD
jgi:hypothetical protein